MNLAGGSVSGAMGKSKREVPTVPNKHLHSRVNFLYQAATLLDNAQKQATVERATINESDTRPDELIISGSGSSREMIEHLQNVALKAQMRLAPSIKRSVCKRCRSILVESTTLKSYIENSSKGRRKPWADVLVRECLQCGTSKRFPVGARRQPRKQDRPTKEGNQVPGLDTLVKDDPSTSSGKG